MSHSRFARSSLLRWLLAGPGAFVLAVLLMAFLPLVLPAGAGGVNHMVLPALLFPLLWAILAIAPVMSLDGRKTGLVYGGLCVAAIIIIGLSIVF